MVNLSIIVIPAKYMNGRSGMRDWGKDMRDGLGGVDGGKCGVSGVKFLGTGLRLYLGFEMWV